MAAFETPSSRALLLVAIVIITLGVIGALPSLVGLIGLLVQGRFTGARANSALITLVISAIILGGGIMLYRRALR